jgi:hypothetical protein
LTRAVRRFINELRLPDDSKSHHVRHLVSTDVNLESTSQPVPDCEPLKLARDTQKSCILLIVLSHDRSCLNREAELGIVICIVAVMVLNPWWLDDSDGNREWEWALVRLPNLSWIWSYRGINMLWRQSQGRTIGDLN